MVARTQAAGEAAAVQHPHDFHTILSTSVLSVADWAASLVSGGGGGQGNAALGQTALMPPDPAPKSSPAPSVASATSTTPASCGVVKAPRVESPPFFVPEEDAPSTTARRLWSPTATTSPFSQSPTTIRTQTTRTGSSKSRKVASLLCSSCGLVNLSTEGASCARASHH